MCHVPCPLSNSPWGFPGVTGFVLAPSSFQDAVPHTRLVPLAASFTPGPLSYRLPPAPTPMVAFRDTLWPCNLGGHWMTTCQEQSHVLVALRSQTGSLA